jgi:predicted alpha-1,6-mannanase (GH76 family)
MPRSIRLCTSALCVLTAFLSAVFTAHAAVAAGPATANPDYRRQTTYAVQALQQWYIPATGLYQKPTDWWNSANAITVLVDYSRATHTTQYLSVIANTFANANKAYGTTSFVNESNDDEGWWALAWVDAYDLTKTPAYLAMAETIFADLTTQWDTTTCNGGIWWSKDLKTSAYKNAIVNEIFLELAASLANRVTDPTKKSQYLAWARKEWAWFRASGMINADNLINDGLNATNPKACTNNNGQTWTYNQGVILGGLAELAQAEHNPALLQPANAIADAVLTHLTNAANTSAATASSGILVDRLRPGQVEGADMPQFKGIFLRNLVRLQNVAPRAQYKAFARANAASILANDQDSNHHFGCYWEGPFDSADGTRQTSALDALIAAIEMR